jgi:hypothetical protein
MHHDRGVYDAGWRDQGQGHGHGHEQPHARAAGEGDRHGHGAEDITERKWVEVWPTHSVRLRFYWSLFVGSVLLFFTLLIGTGHYARTPPPHSVSGIVVFVACIVIALASLGVAAHAWFIRRNLDDAHIFLDRQTLVRGHSFHVRVEQRAQRGLKINEMKVGLICQETIKTPVAPAGPPHEAQPAGPRPATKTIALMEKWETCTRDKITQTARRMTATRSFDIPKDKPASSPPQQKELPVVRWKLRVVTVPAEGPAYHGDFPVFVHASPPQAFWSEISSVDAAMPSRIDRV